MAKAKKPQEEISEAKIRQVIWMIKAGKTKKACCEHLGIAYNTKRLAKIVEDFHEKQEREKRLKKAAQKKIFTKQEKQGIAKAYLNGESQSAIAKQYYISPQRVKNILVEMNVPIRGRGKNSQAKVDHVVQDLEVKFKKDDKVFIPKYNCFGIVNKVYDEDYIDYLENGRQRYIETHPFKPNKHGLAGNHVDPTEGIHYEVYWVLEDGKEMKLNAMKRLRDSVMNVIEQTGREYYSVWRDDEQGGFYHLHRDQIYPVIKAA